MAVDFYLLYRQRKAVDLLPSVNLLPVGGNSAHVTRRERKRSLGNEPHVVGPNSGQTRQVTPPVSSPGDPGPWRLICNRSY